MSALPNMPSPRRRAVVAAWLAGGRPPEAPEIPLNVAFNESLAFVLEGLRACGETWSDIQVGSAVASIIHIAAANGWLAPWERGAA